MKIFRYFIFCLLLGRAAISAALVNPAEADIPEQDWMANVLIKGSFSKTYQLFCKGSLIHEYWVLSSPACFIDPFDTISNTVGSDRAQYAVALGNLGGLFKVEERIISPDGNAMLLRLNRPAKNTPIRVIYRPAAELKGVQVRIYGTEKSDALADPFFNPIGDLPVSCKVDGVSFFSDNRMCYVLSRLRYLLNPMMATGQIIDPLSADVPKRPLHTAITPDNTGDRLYIDYSLANSFPCHEDMGAPIIATLNGELVQVGLVVATGMTTGVPMCNDSFRNYLTTLVRQQGFIASSIDKGVFSQQCPARAELQYEKLTPTSVRFHWEKTHGADGFKVLYTTALGYEAIQSVDIGNFTEAIVDLVPGETYALALQAYNKNCTGLMSAPIQVRIE